MRNQDRTHNYFLIPKHNFSQILITSVHQSRWLQQFINLLHFLSLDIEFRSFRNQRNFDHEQKKFFFCLVRETRDFHLNQQLMHSNLTLKLFDTRFRALFVFYHFLSYVGVTVTCQYVTTEREMLQNMNVKNAVICCLSSVQNSSIHTICATHWHN